MATFVASTRYDEGKKRHFRLTTTSPQIFQEIFGHPYRTAFEEGLTRNKVSLGRNLFYTETLRINEIQSLPAETTHAEIGSCCTGFRAGIELKDACLAFERTYIDNNPIARYVAIQLMRGAIKPHDTAFVDFQNPVKTAESLLYAFTRHDAMWVEAKKFFNLEAATYGIEPSDTSQMLSILSMQHEFGRQAPFMFSLRLRYEIAIKLQQFEKVKTLHAQLEDCKTIAMQEIGN